MKRIITSCFGLGWLPIAPGTWGSLPPMVIAGLMMQFDASLSALSIVMAVYIIIWSIACVALSSGAIMHTGKEDPGEVVADEAAGQAVCYLAIPLAMTGPWTVTGAWIIAVSGFLLFRIFDIIKPWPVNQLEKLPQGWGILADDLMAGAYAGICLYAGCLWQAEYLRTL